MRKNEIFVDAIKDYYYGWEDDKSLIIGAIKKTLKSLPTDTKFYDQFRADEDTTDIFGLELLKSVLTRNDELLTLIEPSLVNWEADRLAQIDLILLKMGSL